LFDEDFDACEDVEFNHRVEQTGFKCCFSPRVGVRYIPRATWAGLFRQMARYGRGRVRLLRKFPETFTAACFLPALLLAGVVVGALASWVSPWLAGAYGAGFGLYILAILVSSVLIAVQKRDGKLLPWLPLVFPVIHFGAGYGILQEWIGGWGRPRASKLAGMIPEQSP
jgi:succinoglycan biosynthesis protein ExoA